MTLLLISLFSVNFAISVFDSFDIGPHLRFTVRLSAQVLDPRYWSISSRQFSVISKMRNPLIQVFMT